MDGAPVSDVVSVLFKLLLILSFSFAFTCDILPYLASTQFMRDHPDQSPEQLGRPPVQNIVSLPSPNLHALTTECSIAP